jgi:hypothetical protein
VQVATLDGADMSKGYNKDPSVFITSLTSSGAPDSRKHENMGEIFYSKEWFETFHGLKLAYKSWSINLPGDLMQTSQNTDNQSSIHKNSTPQSPLLEIERRFKVPVNKLFDVFKSMVVASRPLHRSYRIGF